MNEAMSQDMNRATNGVMKQAFGLWIEIWTCELNYKLASDLWIELWTYFTSGSPQNSNSRSHQLLALISIKLSYIVKWMFTSSEGKMC